MSTAARQLHTESAPHAAPRRTPAECDGLLPAEEQAVTAKPAPQQTAPAERAAAGAQAAAPRRDRISASLAVALSLTGVLTLAGGGGALVTARQAAQVRTVAARKQALIATASRLDEALFASARLYVITGEARYRSRFQAAAARMPEALRAVAALAPSRTGEADAAGGAARAWRARSMQEQRAVRLKQAGQASEAWGLLTATGYERERQQFAQALGRLGSAVDRQTQESLRRTDARMLASAGAGGAALTLLMVSWRLVRRARRHWHGEAAHSQIALQKTQEELRQARQQLDARTRSLQSLTESAATLERRLQSRKEKADRQLTLMETAIESAKDVVMIVEADPVTPRVVRVNRAFGDMTGYDPQEIIGKSSMMLSGPDTDPRTLGDLMNRLRLGKPVQTELLQYRKDGTPFWMELDIQPVHDAKEVVRYWVSIQRDVTERRRAAAKIQWQATHDSLTGLPNRSYYEESLEKAIATAEAEQNMVGVLFFDLDRFKHVNDTLGHMSGDRLLKAVAQRLASCLDKDDIIARLGGDEFTFLLPGLTDPEKASQTAQRLLDSLHAPFPVDGQDLYVTASIGVSVAPQDGRDITTLLKNADIAMYRAKEQGRDGFRLYNETMQARVLDPFQIETQLRKAMEKGDLWDQLYLLYQPQVNLNTGRVFGVEALIRWENPQLGRVSPMHLIAVAEETGLINPIGEWVMRTACKQAARWHKQGRLLRMSVNLSAKQFGPTLVEMIRGILKETFLPPEMLDIELTESTLIQGKQIVGTLQELKDLGVYLSVDDFGIGYSSLSYINSFPLDVLKIDKSFVQGLGEDRKSEALVRSLITLARGIGLEVIAEGVETDLQKAALLQMSCHAIQGYLFSPPTTVSEVEALVDGCVYLNIPASVQRATFGEAKATAQAAAAAAPPKVA